MEKKSLFLAPTFGRAVNDMFYAYQVLFFSILGKDVDVYRKRLAEMFDECLAFLQKIQSEAQNVPVKSNDENKEN